MLIPRVYYKNGTQCWYLVFIIKMAHNVDTSDFANGKEKTRIIMIDKE